MHIKASFRFTKHFTENQRNKTPFVNQNKLFKTSFQKYNEKHFKINNSCLLDFIDSSWKVKELKYTLNCMLNYDKIYNAE